MLTIRSFRYTDINALLQIAQVSFAEEYTAQGMTPAALAQQVRLITRGRMLPFKTFTRLAGIQWEILVAEWDGEIVGCASYMGRNKHMELANLMVTPEYRRRGIGQALLVERLKRLKNKGFSLATTTILASNEASLGNVKKQNFTIFDRYTLLEKTLLLGDPPYPIAGRSLQSSDREKLQALEKNTISAATLQIRGSAVASYFPPLGSRLLNWLTGARSRAHIFVDEEEIIGFMRFTTSKNQTKGFIPRPIIAAGYYDRLPAMIRSTVVPLVQSGKQSVQIALSSEQEESIVQLKERGWRERQTWIRLVKEL